MQALRAFLILTAMPLSLSAHEVKLADGRSVDYTGLKGPRGSSCCGNGDCRMVNSRWLPDNTLLVETAPDLWHAVPPDLIVIPLPEPLRETADKTHACWRGTAQTPLFYCVFPEATGA